MSIYFHIKCFSAFDITLRKYFLLRIKKKLKETNKIKEHPPLNIYTFILLLKKKNKEKVGNFVYLHMEHRLFF